MTTTTTDAGNGARASLPTEVAEVADAFSNACNRSRFQAESADCVYCGDDEAWARCEDCGAIFCHDCLELVNCDHGWAIY